MYGRHTRVMHTFEFARTIQADKERQIEEAGRRARLMEDRTAATTTTNPAATTGQAPSSRGATRPTAARPSTSEPTTP